MHVLDYTIVWLVWHSMAIPERVPMGPAKIADTLMSAQTQNPSLWAHQEHISQTRLFATPVVILIYTNAEIAKALGPTQCTFLTESVKQAEGPLERISTDNKLLLFALHSDEAQAYYF